MKGMGFPSKIPMFDAMRVTKEVHSIGPVILKFVSHCLTITLAGETQILLTMAYNIINSSFRTGRGSSLGKRVIATHLCIKRRVILNVIASRCKLAMDNLTRNQTPKLMSIKTAASFCKENRQACAKTKEVAEISPIKIAFNYKKSERNTIVHLSKSARKLDGEETRTILLNRHKAIPSNLIPNTSEVNVHTCFFEKVRIEGYGMTKS